MASPTRGQLTNLTMSSTGATPATGILSAYTGDQKAAGIQILGTFVGTLQFEQSLDNGTTWIAKTMYPAAGGAGVTSATGTGQWKCAIGGETNLRVRCSAYTSGSPAVTIALTDGMDAGLLTSIPALMALLPAALGQGTMAQSLRVVLPSDQVANGPGTATAGIRVTQGDALDIAGSVSSAAVLFTQDMTGYKALSVQVTSIGTSNTIIFEGNNDNGATWYNAYGTQQAGPNNGGQNTMAALGVLLLPRAYKYMRARVSTYGSGTVTVAAVALSNYNTFGTILMGGGAQQSVAVAVAATGNWTRARIQSAASTNATSVATGTRVIGEGIVANNHATNIAYLKLYAKASAPTVGTDVPVATIALPAGGVPVRLSTLPGWLISTGLAYAITGGAADSDSTNVLADQVTGYLLYI